VRNALLPLICGCTLKRLCSLAWRAQLSPFRGSISHASSIFLFFFSFPPLPLCLSDSFGSLVAQLEMFRRSFVAAFFFLHTFSPLSPSIRVFSISFCCLLFSVRHFPLDAYRCVLRDRFLSLSCAVFAFFSSDLGRVLHGFLCDFFFFPDFSSEIDRCFAAHSPRGSLFSFR